MTHLTFEPKPPGGGRAGVASSFLMRQANRLRGIGIDMGKSLSDVRRAFRWYVGSASAVGIDAERFALLEGSLTYGRPWRVVEVDPTNGGYREVLQVGSTRQEAWLSLRAAYESLRQAKASRDAS